MKRFLRILIYMALVIFISITMTLGLEYLNLQWGLLSLSGRLFRFSVFVLVSLSCAALAGRGWLHMSDRK